MLTLGTWEALDTAFAVFQLVSKLNAAHMDRPKGRASVSELQSQSIVFSIMEDLVIIASRAWDTRRLMSLHLGGGGGRFDECL